ncbi:type I secretion system permease/ATPase [Blastochloris tepida]|uniref:type I secretion system permease/ATPase n=1 Tax=Blastochloris tepida TaxID=2233851 RepID=UPI001FCE64CF|nr:type I secretion system permease/ATPase [Blastochloris tepida]
MSTSRQHSKPAEATPIARTLRACRAAFVALALFSGLINVLMLTSSLFMMQVYDRVLTSHSVPTLVALSVIAIGLYLFQGALEVIRGRLFVRIAERVDAEAGARLFPTIVRMPLRASRGTVDPMQATRDLEAIRSFLSGNGPAALFDLPWIPVYLAVVFALHPLLGWVTVAGSVVLIGLTALADLWSRQPTREALSALSARSHLADTAQRGTEVVTSMGMAAELGQRWGAAQEAFLAAQRHATDVSSGLSALSRTLRYVLQSAMLGLAAYLAILGEISAGSIIAASILGARALAPVDLAIANWRGFVAARQGYHRLVRLFEAFPAPPPRLKLPAPTSALRIESLYVAAPGEREPILKGANFALRAGDGLGVIGPSASGKSTLGRALVGLWPPLKGKVMLDGASLDQWDPEALGPHIGYLPQDVQLFDGTVADNIARMAANAPSEAVIAAAQQAGLHEYILAMADGYNTRVGQGGAHLSAGQRQRLGLARALYGNPFLVVLDEPNANLDAEGEASVAHAIRSVRERGGIAVVIAHRPSAIAAVDQLLVIRAGEIVAFGPKDEVLAKTVRNVASLAGKPGPRPVPAAGQVATGGIL